MALGSLLSLLAGAALFGVVAHVTMPPLAWMALTLLLHATRATTPLPALFTLWIAVYVGLALGNRGILPMSGAGYYAINALLTTAATLPFALDRVGAQSLEGVASTLVFPLAWVTTEFLRSRLTSSATWGSIAYTQYGYLPLMQVAAFVGIWGITFLIAWSASTVEFAWTHRAQWETVRVPLVTWAVVCGVTIVCGTVRVALAPTDRPSLRVATLNRPVDLFLPGEMTRITEDGMHAGERERLAVKLSRLHDWFLEGSRREARAGARLILWPEGNLLVFAHDEDAFLARARQLAAEEHVYLGMGMGTIHPGDALPFENKLVLIDPSGRIVVSYRKSHAVAGWEAGIMKVGDGRVPVVATSEGRLAAAICHDAAFPEFVRQAGKGAADLLLEPVNDWREIKALHFQMDAFRAIENGVPLLRAAASGLSGAFDQWGRVLGVADYFAAGDRTLTVQVPVGHVRTLYARTGDLFAWSCVAALMVALGVGRVW